MVWTQYLLLFIVYCLQTLCVKFLKGLNMFNVLVHVGVSGTTGVSFSMILFDIDVCDSFKVIFNNFT